MKHLMKSMGLFGRALLNNKGKVLIGLGAMAMAPALRWAMERYIGAKAALETEAEEGEEGEGEEHSSSNPPRSRPNKREIYQAPKIPPQNLARH